MKEEIVMVSCEAKMDRERGAREGEAGIGSAGDGQEVLRDRQTGTGRGEGETQKFRGIGKYRQKDTYKHAQRMYVSYPLVFPHLPGQFFPWSHPALGSSLPYPGPGPPAF